MASHVLGFTGDRDAGQEGIELAQQGWLAGVPGSRRVIINRRGEAVEDVASIRAPQEGRDLALSLHSRLQYLAVRELKAAVEANRAKAGGLVILDARSGEILALANWPTYNPNSRDRAARDRMRNRALTAATPADRRDPPEEPAPAQPSDGDREEVEASHRRLRAYGGRAGR